MTPPLAFRLATADELRFVRSSWFKSYQRAGAPDVGYDIYAEGQHRLIDWCIEHGHIVVTTPPTVPEEVCAWACYGILEGVKVLHYVYAKQPYRHLGIAGALVDHVGPFGLHTCSTSAGRRLAAKAGRFNPYLLVKGNPP